MDMKEAVRAAKDQILHVFGDEVLSDPRLEEVEFDDNGGMWHITIGFYRRPDLPPLDGMQGALSAVLRTTPRREYKLVQVSDLTRKAISVKDRELS